jgi:hypothetical protein
LQTFAKRLANNWQTTCKQLANNWQTIGKHLANTWQTLGKQLPNNWQTVGKRLANNWKRNCADLHVNGVRFGHLGEDGVGQNLDAGLFADLAKESVRGHPQDCIV